MAKQHPSAIIDIGSNSVRLVVYAGSARVPAPIFNEKVLAGLGRVLDETGRLPAKGRTRALAALARFRLLVDAMDVGLVEVVATAAVRDAADGRDFVRAVDALGFKCRIISAEREAELAGLGVLSGIPGADGIACDLGGGSVEFVDVAGGRASGGISLPLGVLRLDPSREQQTRTTLAAALDQSGLGKRGRGRPLYLVGGSWRSLARIDLADCNHPLPIVHQHVMARGRARELRKLLARQDAPGIGELAPARQATAPVAAMLLELMVETLEPSKLIVSAFGIREGLLFSSLGSKDRQIDPLIAAARGAGYGTPGFGELGDRLDAWIAPVFSDPPEMARLRHAACLLADAAWPANPAFRPDRAIDIALHGNWVGIDAPGRVVVAQALASAFGDDALPDPGLARLSDPATLQRARDWGIGIRFGQRLSGGVGAILKRTQLTVDGTELTLHLRKGEEALAGERVERSLARLAKALGATGQVRIGR